MIFSRHTVQFIAIEGSIVLCYEFKINIPA
jgi:hypothetical protein